MGKGGPSTFSDHWRSAPADPALLCLLADWISFLLQKAVSWIPVIRAGSNFDSNCRWAVRGDVGGGGYVAYCL